MRVTCPVCRQITTWEENKTRPFCSERCRQIDLGTWASEGYQFPGEETPVADFGDPGQQATGEHRDGD